MKHVKKSMFISTVLMVVMLIAALSTATFAWYTSNNTAASKSTMVGAAEANDANIGIGFYRGAQANEIEFHNLVDSNNQGYLTPVVPAAYYTPLTAEIDNTLVDHFATTVQKQSTGFVADAFQTAGADTPEDEDDDFTDYRRVVQMDATQVGKIVAQSDWVHNYSTNTLTNITTGSNGFNGNYEMIYYIPYYVYNNNVAVGSAGAPAVNDAITVANNVYTKVTADPVTTKTYKVQKVYQVTADGESDPENIDNNTTAVSMDCANKLSRTANFIPQGETYLVLYYDYQIAPYTTATEIRQYKPIDSTNKVNTEMVTAIDANAIFVGYAGDTAGTLNADDFDIKADEVIWRDADPANNITAVHTYPKITEIKYDANGFAYLYKTYNAGDSSALTNKNNNQITWDNFLFTKAAIDNVGFFRTDGSSTKPDVYYTGNSNSMREDKKPDIGVITGISNTSSGTATETFYVTNNGSQPLSSVVVSLNVLGDNASLLRIAIFKNGTYCGTLASADDAPTTFGTILIGSKATDMQTYKATNSIELGALSSGAQNAAEFQLVAWFDGTLLNDVAADKNCSFTLTFTATK